MDRDNGPAREASMSTPPRQTSDPSDSSGKLSFWRRRWLLTGACVGAAALPGVVITFLFAAPGYFIPILPQVLGAVLLGPLSNYVVYPSRMDAGWWLILAFLCLPLMLAHVLHPRLWTAVITLLGFSIWYGHSISVMLSASP